MFSAGLGNVREVSSSSSIVQSMIKTASVIETALNQQGVLAVDPMLVMTEFL